MIFILRFMKQLLSWAEKQILQGSIPYMSLWREKLFALMSKNAQRPTAFFKIPPNQVIEVGIQVEI
jgi:KUP system potassium uptake protein